MQRRPPRIGVKLAVLACQLGVLLSQLLQPRVLPAQREILLCQLLDIVVLQLLSLISMLHVVAAAAAAAIIATTIMLELHQSLQRPQALLSRSLSRADGR